MSVRTSSPAHDGQMAARPDVAAAIRAGLIGGLVGGISIWIYEAVVWVGVQHQMPLGGIPQNATGLAFIWPYFRRRGYEATLVALIFAVILWIVMHSAIALVSSDHPNYLDPTVVIGGFMSHLFYAVPLALVVKRLMSATSG